jgi:putative nucleotidyltransferase with HDIG domain
MRIVSIENCQPGMEIAKPIFSESGTILVGMGISLTARMIQSLKGRYVSHVYIRDKATEDLEIIDQVPLELRVESAGVIQKTFNQLQSADNKRLRSINPLNVDRLQQVFKNILHELRTNQNAMTALTDVVLHDNYIFSHSVNVTIYSLAIALKLGYNDKQLNDIALGGVFHDIGKVKIPLELLNKKGRLSAEEYDMIKKHSGYGFEILRNMHEISLPAAHCAFQHHEKLDGSGYPRGLKGDEIHPYAKIMAVGDVFDALTSNRSYRGAMLPHEAMEILFAGAYTHFDPLMLQTFRQSVASYPIGITVELNTGETGVVVRNVPEAPDRPVIRIIEDPAGEALDKPYELELSKNLTVMITKCDAIV